MKKKIVLITGITGQDGAYLANLLLNKGYKVYGTYRRSSSLNLWRLEELGILESVELLSLELLEKSNIERVIKLIKPDEIYNLAAQSFVALSFENPIYTVQADAVGVLKILESIRIINKKIKFYQASSSEMFGEIGSKKLNEKSHFHQVFGLIPPFARRTSNPPEKISRGSASRGSSVAGKSQDAERPQDNHPPFRPVSSALER